MKTLIACCIAMLAYCALSAHAADEPEVVYTKFHRAAASGDLNDMLRYANETQRREIGAMSAAQKAAQTKMLAALIPRAFTLKNKAVNPDGQRAQLIVTGSGDLQADGKPETLYGTIRMVKEGSDWKVAEANWNNVAPAGLQAAPKPAAKAAQAPAQPKSGAPVVGSMGGAPERKLGAQKPACVFKPVMTAEDLENCK